VSRYDRREHPDLRRGARGGAVARCQRRLAHHLEDLDEVRFVDGIFGPVTDREVRRFQKRERLAVDGIVGRDTWSALLAKRGERVRSPVGRTASAQDRRQAADQVGAKSGGGELVERVRRAFRRKGYVFHDDGRQYHLNIVGVRGPSADINHFDDRIILLYRDESGTLQAVEYEITTDPGEYYTKHKLLNKAGAAILVPGQYRDTYKIGKHRNKYLALCQLGGPVRVWRDANRDDRLDRTGKIYEGWYGINIHRAGQSGTTAKVGRYSAGCQVFKDANNFATFMSLAGKSRQLRGNRFTYTLLEQADLRRYRQRPRQTLPEEAAAQPIDL